MASSSSTTTANTAGRPAGCTLSSVLGETISGFARDPNDTLNAALYSYNKTAASWRPCSAGTRWTRGAA